MGFCFNKIPVILSKQRFFNNPDNNCTPAIAYIINQNKTIKISLKIIGKASNNVNMIFFKFLKELIVFKGLNTRNTLKTEILKSLSELYIKFKIPVKTMKKSKIFHPFLKYEFLLTIKPNPNIFNIISIM